MDLAWAAAGAIAGLPAGAALRRPALRLSVPAGEPARTACPSCGAPLSGWISPRCAACRRWLGPPAGLEVATAIVLAVLLGRFARQADVAAFAFFGLAAVALAAIDLAVKRLPDRITLPSYPVLLVLLAAAAIADRAPAALGWALLGGAALGAVFLLLALIAPGQLGLGDVKLAGLAGIALGWLGWPAVILGACFGFVLAGLVSLALLAARRIKMADTIAFGPFLLAGALLAILILPGVR